jgi:hypothetical protein
MSIKLDLREFDVPLLEFGGPGMFTDPRIGLREGGPFDLRFGAARSGQIKVGLVGDPASVTLAQAWLDRVRGTLAAVTGAGGYPHFPGFEAVFRAKLVTDDRWTIAFDQPASSVEKALEERNPVRRFETVLELYHDAIRRLARLETTKPDVVICCLSDEVLNECSTVTRTLTPEERRAARELRKRQASTQLDMFDFAGVEEQPEDLLNRDFRRALKARAMIETMPVQIVTSDLLLDDRANQEPAARAWNSSVGLYYKAGGIPWRMKLDGPETCFVGISFHHVKTRERHLVKSSIAQAFSSQGEGFALRGGDVEYDEKQGRNVHLTEDQAHQLGVDVLAEYRDRVGGIPLRVVLHKTSNYSDAERSGFRRALAEVPVVELINIMPTSFRLVRFGSYPPNRGTLCTVNEDRSYLFTTGYMPELKTYPGPHIPSPVQLAGDTPGDIDQVARDILGLARMNWNTASITGGMPVTLFFARRVGGIMAEFGAIDKDARPPTSFRYYM